MTFGAFSVALNTGGYLGAAGDTSVEAAANTPVTQAITLTKMYVQLSGSIGNTATFTLRKNGVSQAITCQDMSSNKCNDTAHSVSLVAGDVIDISISDTAADTESVNVMLSN